MKALAYLRRLLAFGFSRNPLLWAGLALSAAGVIVELLAMTVLFPLSEFALGRDAATGGAWATRALQGIGVHPDLKSVVILFLGLLGARILIQLAGQSIASLLGKRLHAQISSTAFARFVETLSLRSIEERSVGYYITLAGDESFRASNLVIAINQFTSAALLAMLYFVSIFVYSWTMGIAVTLFLAATAILMLGTFRRSHRLGERQVVQSQTSGSVFLDALNGLRTVRALAAQAYVTGRYRDEVFRYARTLFLVDFIGLLSRAVPALLLIAAALIFLGGRELSPQSGFDPAFAFALLAFLLRLFPVLGQTLNLLQRIVVDARAGRDVVEAIRDRGATAGSGLALQGPVHRVQFEQVSFEYLPGKPVLEDVSIVLERGASYAISGPSGSGKSTLIDLLLRFHDASAGRILVNGVSVNDYDVSSLRRGLLLLGQQTMVFNDTVYNNVAFGIETTRPAVEAACRMAQIHETIAALPQGYDTPLTYQGSNLSGGQRQRIGIARVLLRDPDVLILDESTSALDEATRNQLVDDILRVWRERIVVFVTHDPLVASKVTRVIDLSAINRARPAAPMPGQTP